MERRLVPHLVLSIACLVGAVARLTLPMRDRGLLFLLGVALPALGIVAAWRYRRERLAVLATAEDADGEVTAATPRRLGAAAAATTLLCSRSC